MSKFKVGDRVVCVNSSSGKNVGGITGTVIWNPGGLIGIEFDIHIDGHSCGGLGKNGYCWNVNEDDVRHYQLPPSIHITTDGKTTHAVLKEGGKVSKRAKAICSPHDEFDFETGARIAFDRLCTSLAESSTLKGVREVKRPAKVGEWVKFIEDHGGRLTPGSIHRVEFERDGTLFFPGDFMGFVCSDHDKYVVLEGYTPDPEKPKYYNGKVVCVDLNGLNLDSYTVGKVYAIVDGVLTNDKGKKINPRNPVKSFDEWCKFSSSKFIEFKGEA